jgi:hypothetical protein
VRRGRKSHARIQRMTMSTRSRGRTVQLIGLLARLATVCARSTLDRPPAGVGDSHVGDFHHSAADSSRNAVPQREPGADEASQHPAGEAVDEHALLARAVWALASSSSAQRRLGLRRRFRGSFPIGNSGHHFPCLTSSITLGERRLRLIQCIGHAPYLAAFAAMRGT